MNTSITRAVKRLMDVALAGMAMILASPLLCGVAIVIRITMGRPVLFAQQRIGRHGSVFTLVKFRTMTPTVKGADSPATDADRLTPLGRWLRNTSIDELPELLNVIRGDMSLVGPRPLLIQYRERYSPEQWRRHEVRPGLTGLVQVSGRNSLTWPEKFRLDVWYVDNWSLRLDIEILWKTLKAVIQRQGVSSPDTDTMPEFMGER